MSAGALPTFLVIGAAKCGTSSLHEYLGEHPEVQTSRTKELMFFIEAPDLHVYRAPPPRRLGADLGARGNHHRDLDWYRSNFDPAFRVRGESSPGYTAAHYPGASERIASALPDAKLVYCVRDPVARTLSSYRFQRGRGVESRPLAEAVVPGSYYTAPSRYAARLEPFLDRFPRERILIVEAERLDHDRRATLREVFRFLEVDEDFWSPALERRWNVTAEQGGLRWRAISRARRLPWWSAMADRIPRPAVWAVQRALLRARARENEPPPQLPAAVLDELREDAQRFRALTGRDFPPWSV